MKNAIAALIVMFAAHTASATSPLPEGQLDGQKFCRTIIRDGSFGQPKGKAKHCVSFEAGEITDNANTFFGNPPENYAYELDEQGVIYNLNSGEPTPYTYVNGSVVYNGVIMKRVP